MGTRARVNKPRETPFLRAGAAPPAADPATSNPWVKLLLLLLGVALLSLSFAPIKQFYLAPFGLVPWLVVLNACKTQGRSLLWSWLAGVLFFAANMWWLVFVTVPGAIALMVILGPYWAAAGWLIRGTGLLPGVTGWGAGAAATTDDTKQPAVSLPAVSLPAVSLSKPSNPLNPSNPSWPALRHHPALRPLVSVFGIAVVWVAVSEWLRATWPFGGLPWLFLGYTQTPALVACQIADITGVYGVSFCVALVNAWVALFVINRFSSRNLLPAGAVVLALLLGVLVYGWYRLGQKTTYPGPSVMVVQSNVPQSNTGDKGADPSQLVDFHLRTTERALMRPDTHVDLVVWSETMAPPIGKEDREIWKGSEWGDFLDLVHERIGEMARTWQAAFLIGAEYAGDFHNRPTGPYAADRRNSAYFYGRDGRQSDVRYDKIHRVPFGEYIPFKDTVPPLYHLLISFGPPDMEDYQLHAGDPRHATVFTLSRLNPSSGPGQASQPGEPWRFVTPICFEDIDGPLVAWMFRPPGGDGPKQADFIVNLTNDGWFKANEMPQHLQAAVFRSIENRAPTARSVNTGISGFIDSTGRIDPDNLTPAGTEGSKIATLPLDHRTTFYTHRGDLFADICAAAAGIMAVAGAIRWWMARKRA